MLSDFDLQPTLVGENIVLRPLARGDFEELHAVASDPLIWAQHPDHLRWQRPVFEKFFNETLASGGALAAENRSSGRLIGTSRYKAYSNGDLEIGWTFLDRSFWGGRTNLEMKRLMIDHGFKKVDSIILRANIDNRRSRRAIEKLGAVFEAQTDGPFGPSVWYRLSRDAWTSR